MKEKKLVIVKDSGPIPELSFICGPVLNPTRIDLGVIAKMVGAGRTVYECNPFNTDDRVLLDITNVKSNNFTTETVSTKTEAVVEEKAEEVKEEVKETPEPVQETVVEENEEVTEPVTEAVVEEVKEEVKETPVQKPQNNYQQNKKNKNKNNKH